MHGELQGCMRAHRVPRVKEVAALGRETGGNLPQHHSQAVHIHLLRAPAPANPCKCQSASFDCSTSSQRACYLVQDRAANWSSS